MFAGAVPKSRRNLFEPPRRQGPEEV